MNKAKQRKPGSSRGELTIVVGDLVGSRRIADRRRVGRRVERTLESIAVEFADQFVAPPLLTVGIDEFSAVMIHPAMSYRCMREINREMHPYAFRLAAVTGAIDIQEDSGNAARMDGPGFHRAAEELKLASRQNQTIRFALGREGEPEGAWGRLSACLTQLANLAYTLESGRTATMREICHLYAKLGKQALVAKRKEISQPAVSDILSQAHYRQVRDAQTQADEILAAWPK